MIGIGPRKKTSTPQIPKDLVHSQANPAENRVPPYVDILVTHTRLSVYSSVINHPTAPLEARQFFRTASLSAALNVMRAAVQGEQQLFSMPNNTAIMVSFAACFALRFSTQLSGAPATSSALAPSVRTLIEETADVLGRIGNITRHRNGMCGLYAKFLRILVKKAAAETGASGGGSSGGGLTSFLVRGGAGGNSGGGHAGGEMGESTPRMVDGQLYSDAAARRGGALGGGGGGRMPYAVSAPGGSRRKTGSTASASGGMGGYASLPPVHKLSPYDTGVPAWSTAAQSELFPFSSMSGDQIVEALSRAGGEIDTAAGYGPGMGGGGGGVGGGGGDGGGGGPGGAGTGGGFAWDDGGTFDWMPQWSNWPDFGFS